MAQVKPAASPTEKQTVIEYMLSVVNDPKATDVRRDRMALAILQYGNSRAPVDGGALPLGKKTAERSARAKTAGQNFAARPPPKLVISNT